MHPSAPGGTGSDAPGEDSSIRQPGTGRAPRSGPAAARARNRARVIEALLALFDTGVLDPTPAAIAAAAGVSERSVFRYFDSLDDLRQAVVARAVERSRPFLGRLTTGPVPLDERIERFAVTRQQLWAQTAGATRVAFLRSPFVPTIATEVRRVRTRLHRQVTVCFRPELEPLASPDRRRVVLAIDALTSFGAWELLTGMHRCTGPDVAATWALALHALLDRGQPSAG